MGENESSSFHGRPRLWFQNAAGTGTHYVVPNVDLRTNLWTHVAFVVNEATAELHCYINGELVHTFTGVSNALKVNKLYVGRDDRTGWQYPFMGQVADIRVWEAL